MGEAIKSQGWTQQACHRCAVREGVISTVVGEEAPPPSSDVSLLRTSLELRSCHCCHSEFMSRARKPHLLFRTHRVFLSDSDITDTAIFVTLS